MQAEALSHIATEVYFKVEDLTNIRKLECG